MFEVLQVPFGKRCGWRAWQKIYLDYKQWYYAEGKMEREVREDNTKISRESVYKYRGYTYRRI